MQRLELLICTINEGIKRVPDLLLSKRPDVQYLVSWQQTGTIQVTLPQELTTRDDVKVVTMEGRGLARNRNNALKHASGDILLLADDDATYKDEYFDRILYNFRKYPKADFICFQARDREGKMLKPYADKAFIYAQRPSGTYLSSIEIAFRRNAAIPFFDERFGLGSQYLACGEEEVFIHSAYKQGFKIIYVPEVIVETDANTTGKRFLTFAACRRAKGAVLCYIYGPVGAAARSLKHVMKIADVDYKRKMSFYNDMISGIRFIQTGRI